MLNNQGSRGGDSNNGGPSPLRDALREARIEAAERTGVVVELRDAELARLEILNEALDPVFADIPATVEFFDRGISQGDTPRLWIDMVAHVVMGHDKRNYRFVQDTRNGRTIIAESHDIPTMVKAVTQYVARRLVERERSMVVGAPATSQSKVVQSKPRRFWTFAFGFIVGAAALFGAAVIYALRAF
jgi:hypothetical protein